MANIRADANNCCNYGNQVEYKGQQKLLKRELKKKKQDSDWGTQIN